ncbi:hypothetical protein F5883DRAFT_145604 [Diaporthe sp. PMI_573]|nr:hypothetical protein F5883DRAFT_145604 [Diaporthaceae sp. PMI_573]
MRAAFATYLMLVTDCLDVVRGQISPLWGVGYQYRAFPPRLGLLLDPRVYFLVSRPRCLNITSRSKFIGIPKPREAPSMLLSWVASCGTEILAMTSGDDDKFAALNDACDVIPGPGGPGSVTDLFIARGGRFRVSGACASRLMGRSQTAVSGKRRKDGRRKKKGRTNGLDCLPLGRSFLFAPDPDTLGSCPLIGCKVNCLLIG